MFVILTSQWRAQDLWYFRAVGGGNGQRCFAPLNMTVRGAGSAMTGAVAASRFALVVSGMESVIEELAK
jgi:hypothetical protein